MTCTIIGETKEAIAETAAFFWSLKDPGQSMNTLQIIYPPKNFDFRRISSEQLARMFGSNPRRKVKLVDAKIDAEQSVLLASRPLRTDLKLTHGCSFQDGGAAFVQAIHDRQSTTFGTLRLGDRDYNPDPVCLRNMDSNMQRLLQTPNR